MILKPTLTLLTALLLTPLAALHAADAATKTRPNILWILVDDIGLDLGCYGRKEVHTPNLDRLASEGARYTRAFTPASVCSPCRSSFITGLYPNQVFSHNMRIYAPLVKHALPNGVECFTKYIRDAGYAVGMPSKYQKTDWGFETPKAPAFDIKNWDELIKKEPFFCEYQFAAPHRPFLPCKEHPVDRSKVQLAPFEADLPEVREELGAYLEYVNLLDMQVGKLIDQLKSAGLYEKTIIVFTGDNGPAIHRGKCFLYDRGIAAPLIVRVPAAFKPDFKPGAVIDELVATGIDLAPTFVHWAGGKTPDYMKGRFFFGPDKQQAPEYIFGLRDRHDAEIDRIRSVRSKDFKYLRNYSPENTYDEIGMNNVLATRAMREAFKQGKLPPEQAAYFQKKAEEELYDLKTDPFELKNLVADPALSGTLQKMRAALDQWIIETNDEGRLQEDPKLVEESRKTLLKTREDRGDKPKKKSEEKDQ